MLFTVSDARTAIAPYVEAGACPTSSAVLSVINEATQRLMNKATWWNLRRIIRFYTTNNTITMPREVEKVLKVTAENVPVRNFNMAYEYLEGGPGEQCPTGGSNRDLLDMGDGWPIFFDIPAPDTTTTTDGGPCQLVAFSTNIGDVDREMTIFGVDSYSADICGVAGTPGVALPITQWDGGVEGSVREPDLSLAANHITTQSFKEITGVVKPVTLGHVCLYTYEPTTHRMYFLAKYHPDETRPSYRRYRIFCPGLSDYSNIGCLVQLRYVPMIRDSDVLLIQNLGALKLMAMAIREENDRNLSNAEVYEQKAYRVLNEEQQAKSNNDVILQMSDDFALGSVKNMI